MILAKICDEVSVWLEKYRLLLSNLSDSCWLLSFLASCILSLGIFLFSVFASRSEFILDDKGDFCCSWFWCSILFFLFLKNIWWSRAWCLVWCKFLFLWGSWFENNKRMFSAFLLNFLFAQIWFSLFLVTLSFLHIALYDINFIFITSIHFYSSEDGGRSEMFLKYLKLLNSSFSSNEGCKSNSIELNRNAAKTARSVTHTLHILPQLPQLCKGYSALQVWFKHVCFPWNEFLLYASIIYGIKNLPVVANNKSSNGWISWRAMLQPAESQ